MEPIDRTLKRILSNVPDSTPAGANNREERFDLPGDPNCPICHGIGFVYRNVPMGHPDFGRTDFCACRTNEIARKAFQNVFKVSNLEAFKDMTFDTFKVFGRMGLGDEQVNSLKIAYDQAFAFSNSLHGWLLLMGGYGVGKTHLAAAIANNAVQHGVPTLFLTVPDLLDWLRGSYDDDTNSYSSRFEEIKSINLLVLDDLGTQNATPWAEEKLYQIFNHRYVNKLPTVVTTNQALEEIEGRIQSRLRDPELVTVTRISAPDYRHPLQDSSQPKLSSLDLYSRYTFGNFTLRTGERLDAEKRRGLERAFEAAQHFAEDPRGWVVFAGPNGSGKTHLAAAIANFRYAMGQPPIMVVVPDLLDHLRSTFSPNSPVSYDEIFEQVRGARLLILDDLGTQSTKPWAREKLYQILNYRYVAELPTVITTCVDIDQIDPQVKSRMLDRRTCTIYSIEMPPFLGSTILTPSDKPRQKPRLRNG